MMNKEKNFASAVIYVHNAEKTVGSFLRTIISVMEENFDHSEIICVNDCSTDGSSKVIEETSLSAENTSVSAINMSYYHGMEMAMNAGVDMAIGDFVFEFDSTNPDFDLAVIMQVYRRVLEGYDIVSAAPDNGGRVTSMAFYRIFNSFSGIPTDMTTESFRVLSRRAINRISSMNRTIPYRKVVYANCGLKTDTFRYTVVEGRDYRLDQNEKEYRLTLAVDSLILFTDLGYQFSKAMSFLMIIITVGVLAYTLAAFAISNPVEGWTSTVLFLSIGFFGLFVILTIVIKYLQIIVELVFKRKHYSFESIEKYTK